MRPLNAACPSTLGRVRASYSRSWPTLISLSAILVWSRCPAGFFVVADGLSRPAAQDGPCGQACSSGEQGPWTLLREVWALLLPSYRNCLLLQICGLLSVPCLSFPPFCHLLTADVVVCGEQLNGQAIPLHVIFLGLRVSLLLRDWLLSSVCGDNKHSSSTAQSWPCSVEKVERAASVFNILSWRK